MQMLNTPLADLHVINELRDKLTRAFHICAYKGWDNWTYTHISVRIPGTDAFLINPFETLYSSVTPESLVLVDRPDYIEDFFDRINPTGGFLHRAIYRARSDVNAIFHLHTAHGVAVSSMACGLLPISQFALHFYNRISRHSYDSLVLGDEAQTELIARDLNHTYAMLLDNHGTLTCGQTLEEAFFFTHHLEEACRVQCLILNSNTPYIQSSPEMCEKACRDLLSFEKQRGARDWAAAHRLFDC